jgi:hypothetical protein
MNLVIEGGALRADVSNPWPFATDFEHVSGEHFLAHISKAYVDLDEVAAAEFDINAQGKVNKLRLQFEEGAEMIEFVRG